MNKVMKLRFGLLALVTVMMGAVVSCDDDDDYNSTLPVFSDITFSEETLYTNQYVTATAVQYKKGKLLDRTTYSWSLSDEDADATLVYNSGVTYDENNSDPVCTFTTPATAGTYTITLTASYNISGRAGNIEEDVDIEDGSASYSVSALKGYATVTKNFTVVNE